MSNQPILEDENTISFKLTSPHYPVAKPDYEDMASRDRANHILATTLRHQGHRCVHTPETYPIQVDWCGQTPCRDAKS